MPGEPRLGAQLSDPSHRAGLAGSEPVRSQEAWAFPPLSGLQIPDQKMGSLARRPLCHLFNRSVFNQLLTALRAVFQGPWGWGQGEDPHCLPLKQGIRVASSLGPALLLRSRLPVSLSLPKVSQWGQ